MNIMQKLAAKLEMHGNPPVTIAFLGDSVTQGCFECYTQEDNRISTVFDSASAYSTRLRELLALLYPRVQVNIINSGISGDATPGAVARLERDVLRYCPDLVVVSFGLNDCCRPDVTLAQYTDNLRQIFSRIRQRGAEVIFLTQNYMNTYASYRNPNEFLREASKDFMKYQLNGDLKRYMHAAAETARSCGARVCDLYRVWEKLDENGVDTTELLANKINHPIREYHYYIAIKLLETMMEV